MKKNLLTLGLSLLLGAMAMPTTAQVVNDDNEDGVTKLDASRSKYDYRQGEVLVKFKDEAPVQILKEVEKSVDDFACGASQFDDLTMLCVHYIGKTDTEEGTK